MTGVVMQRTGVRDGGSRRRIVGTPVR
jgi:hypothetical protein